jgi:hypothetical protein
MSDMSSEISESPSERRDREARHDRPWDTVSDVDETPLLGDFRDNEREFDRASEPEQDDALRTLHEELRGLVAPDRAPSGAGHGLDQGESRPARTYPRGAPVGDRIVALVGLIADRLRQSGNGTGGPGGRRQDTLAQMANDPLIRQLRATGELPKFNTALNAVAPELARQTSGMPDVPQQNGQQAGRPRGQVGVFQRSDGQALRPGDLSLKNVAAAAAAGRMVPGTYHLVQQDRLGRTRERTVQVRGASEGARGSVTATDRDHRGRVRRSETAPLDGDHNAATGDGVKTLSSGGRKDGLRSVPAWAMTFRPEASSLSQGTANGVNTPAASPTSTPSVARSNTTSTQRSQTRR